ncbi:DNA-binding response regulator [Siminovitchia terrae]|uniref:DNA-binding response regulator n=1 Tax=Siminovitchia terrae TaxID=1914933 RepID=A0A429XC59_SIMTE|nr:response regulator transcription factor [Siminovitchia terrae]RST61044.1 response regulator transcription factor [Siminovitchia terrae]GIN90898.1 DNA-binding response regulator [Siminovitchia terrae]GIN97684.1 DNA-binding response regulator [Siminovitchia terrae]
MLQENLIGKSVLVVEDDPKIRNLVKIYLNRDGYEVIEAVNGLEAKEKIEEMDPCILILDLMLPEISGEEICRWVREEYKSRMPIIMLTAKVSEKERIKGFKLGADDYVVKPFSPGELMVRIEAVLRRTASRCGKLSFTGFTIKPAKGEASIDGEQLELTNFEFKLLHIFMQHPGQILSREQILSFIYENNEKAVSDRTIDVHIKNLREKIKTKTPKDYIQTVRGMGYKFVAL